MPPGRASSKKARNRARSSPGTSVSPIVPAGMPPPCSPIPDMSSHQHRDGLGDTGGLVAALPLDRDPDRGLGAPRISCELEQLDAGPDPRPDRNRRGEADPVGPCLLYTSDAA